MEGNLRIPNLKNSIFVWNQAGILFSYHTSTEWSNRKKEKGDSGDGLCDDPLKESCSTFFGEKLLILHVILSTEST
jgi:hypothetical protein